MSMYGIPEELICLIKAMYSNFESAVVEEGETREWFQVHLSEVTFIQTLAV